MRRQFYSSKPDLFFSLLCSQLCLAPQGNKFVESQKAKPNKAALNFKFVLHSNYVFCVHL